MFELARIDHWWDVSRRFPVLRENGRGVLKALGYAHVIQCLPAERPARVLEFGHGWGSPLMDLFAAELELWGLDGHVEVPYWTREEFLARAAYCRQQHPRVRYVDGLMGAGRNALPEASFDVVCSVSVLEELEPPAISEIVADAARLLRPGGLFVNSMDCTTRFTERVEHFFACQEAEGLRFVKPGSSPALDWSIHDVAFEDPCFVMQHYMGYQPDEGRRWPANFATVLSASRRP
jgi:SAM-dependent methyltransferase